jgi:hypothetical protein
MLGDADRSHRHILASSGAAHEADAALAGLWGGSGNGVAARAWDSGPADGDRQLRAMKSSIQLLQIELMDVRQQAERSAESEARVRAQLQRVLSENDAALVMLGQVRAVPICLLMILIINVVMDICSGRRS